MNCWPTINIWKKSGYLGSNSLMLQWWTGSSTLSMLRKGLNPSGRILGKLAILEDVLSGLYTMKLTDISALGSSHDWWDTQYSLWKCQKSRQQSLSPFFTGKTIYFPKRCLLSARYLHCKWLPPNFTLQSGFRCPQCALTRRCVAAYDPKSD